jgi:maltose-binding protein MalE
MNKRWIGLVAALMIISIVGAAQPVSGSAQTPELVMWVRDDYAWNLEPALAAFEADTGVAVRVETMPLNDIRGRFPAEAGGANAPDIITDSDEFVRGYLDQNLLEPVALGGKTTDYVPFAVQTYTYGGRLYGLPYALENLVFVRNTRLVPELPRTWEDVEMRARVIKESGAAEFGLVLPGVDSFFYFAYPIIDAYGGYVFGTTPDGTIEPHDIGLANDGAMAAVNWMQRMVQDGLMPSDMDSEEAYAAFEQGRAAMIIAGPWDMWRIEQSGVPFALSAFPAAVRPGRPFVHVQAFLINARSDKKALAQDFLTQYIATEDTMLGLAENAGRVSAHMALFEAIDNPVMRGFEDALQYGQRYPDNALMGPVWEAMSRALNQVISGSLPPDLALNAAVAAIRQEIGGGQ